MKKLISILLCLAILTCTFAVGAVAAEDSVTEETQAINWDGDPVIFLQGFTGSPLIKDQGLETQETILGAGSEFDITKILTSLPGILTGIVIYAITGDSEMLANGFADLAAAKLDNMSCMPDGSSKYNVTTFPYYAKDASVATLVANGQEAFIPEAGLTTAIREYVPDESLYIFNNDWRMGQVENAESLDRFIGEVLAITGKDKVDIYALSHGGQLAATYLYYHGTEGEVDNVVLNVPSICGTSIVNGLLGDGAANFNMDELSRFLSVMLQTEADLRFIGKILPGEFLNKLLKVVFVEVFQPVALNFGSIWDFMDIETYDLYKAKCLDPTVNAGLIEKADKMHYDCMANIGEGLRAAQASGVSISIMSNYGTRLGSGEAIDADFVIDTESTSGAYTASFGECFADNYTPKYTVCDNESHNHISPSRTVDATCAYLPENTWFINGQYHGQAAYDSYSLSLLLKLLLTDDIKDIYSDPDYPQFELAQCPVDAVYAKFTNTVSGRFNDETDTLLIRNISREHTLVIRSLKTDGVEFEIDKKTTIAPGEEILVTCTGLDDEDVIAIEMVYARKGKPFSPHYTKTFYFTAA